MTMKKVFLPAPEKNHHCPASSATVAVCFPTNFTPVTVTGSFLIRCTLNAAFAVPSSIVNLYLPDFSWPTTFPL